MIMEVKNAKFRMVRSNISKGCFTRALMEAMLSGPLNTAFELLHSYLVLLLRSHFVKAFQISCGGRFERPLGSDRVIATQVMIRERW